MTSEKTTGRQAADRGDQVAGLHNVVGAMAGGLDEHSAAGFTSRCGQLRSWPRRVGVAEGPAPQRGRDDRSGAIPSG